MRVFTELTGHTEGPVRKLLLIKEYVWSLGGDNIIRVWRVKVENFSYLNTDCHRALTQNARKPSTSMLKKVPVCHACMYMNLSSGLADLLACYG